MNAKFLRINGRDVIRGFVVAFFSSALSSLALFFNSGGLPDMADLKKIALVGVSAGVGYIVKNFLTNSNDQMFRAEKKAGN